MQEEGLKIPVKTYTLHEVMQSVQSVLQKTYANRQYWVSCELSRISLHAQSGHCYIELVDKNENSIVAQQRGIIWSDKYATICEKFKAVTNTSLCNGMKVLFQCSVSFHAVHGLSLNITDIEPSFTLGEMARMKNESIAKLRAGGLFDLNRSKGLAILPQRIAVVSVATSRGYQDFMTTLENHFRKYRIETTLFEAVLQGENAVPTLSRAIKLISGKKEMFDAIAIIRGGAGDAGLACYDEYSLASLIASCALPVITGIGHATNETVCEMVAYRNCITPTAAATFILEKFDTQFLKIGELQEDIKKITIRNMTNAKQHSHIISERFGFIVRNLLERERSQLTRVISGMPGYISGFFSLKRQGISNMTLVIHNTGKFNSLNRSQQLISQAEAIIKKFSSAVFKKERNEITLQKEKIKIVNQRLSASKNNIDHLTEKIKLLDPSNTLKRGYSITRYKNKAITSSSNVSENDIIETEVSEGIIISKVTAGNTTK